VLADLRFEPSPQWLWCCEGSNQGLLTDPSLAFVKKTLSARPDLERDWREALGTSPGSVGKGKPELTEARRAEGIPEGPSRPSAAVGQCRSPGAAKGQVELEKYHPCLFTNASNILIRLDKHVNLDMMNLPLF